MKTLKDLESFRLGKGQMNAVTGGGCAVYYGDGYYDRFDIPTGMTAAEAAKILHETYDEAYPELIVNCR